ncbi:SMI1 / KNR4 family protein [Planctomycetes bacterium Pla163]|uniref:SMI1 / KNR4 family protein n=1 Tax=Rohdeia mirabilis TaxID=2528008 RepID=A0A518CWX9_9BACT|nr:SMI1 / KNR4 family protein [Planctomycetes bacterium Pla163]
MITPADFWGANYYKNPPLTEAALALAEERLGVTLPPEYVDLLRVQNGGYTARFAYPMSTQTSWADDHVPFDEMAGVVVDPDHGGVHNILLSQSMAEEWELPPNQVLLAGDGHWWITLDYRGSTVPAVAWLDVETGEDIEVAPTFRDFLKGLVPASQFEDMLDETAAEGISFKWLPERIEVTIEDGPDPRREVHCLTLEQRLEPGETGWTMSKIFLPANWGVLSHGFEGQDLCLVLTDGRTFKINRDNYGDLSMAVMECYSKGIAALENAWRVHAEV